MMRQRARKILLINLICVLIACLPVFADDTSTTAEPYTQNEFPQWAYDLRRTEIISFGSLPFVTLGVTLGMGTYKYVNGEISSFPNPFNKSSSTYTTDEQIKIIKLSSTISIGLGITDLVINLIQRSNKERRLKKIQESKEKVSVTPLSPEEAGELIKENSEEVEMVQPEEQEVQ